MLSSPEIKAEVLYFKQLKISYACPKNLGLVLTGDYYTGGNRVVNKAFMNFYEGKDARAY
jgi:amidophosphoribosyltransferase